MDEARRCPGHLDELKNIRDYFRMRPFSTTRVISNDLEVVLRLRPKFMTGSSVACVVAYSVAACRAVIREDVAYHPVVPL